MRRCSRRTEAGCLAAAPCPFLRSPPPRTPLVLSSPSHSPAPAAAAQDGDDDEDAAQPMGADERLELLGHLKAKWGAVNAAYLKLGFVADIDSAVKRKEGLERELAAIEGDIKRLSRGDVVMVVRD